MTAQKHLLRAGIMNLVMYARGMSDSKLRALGASHSRAALDIRPELYDLWLDALLMAVAEHDRDCDAETRDAWRDVMGRGIAVIKSYY
ncbi:globin [Pseudomonas aeruginosa]|nr:globin [Pseudomonas aeruginosa]